MRSPQERAAAFIAEWWWKTQSGAAAEVALAGIFEEIAREAVDGKKAAEVELEREEYMGAARKLRANARAHELCGCPTLAESDFAAAERLERKARAIELGVRFSLACLLAFWR